MDENRNASQIGRNRSQAPGTNPCGLTELGNAVHVMQKQLVANKIEQKPAVRILQTGFTIAIRMVNELSIRHIPA